MTADDDGYGRHDDEQYGGHDAGYGHHDQCDRYDRFACAAAHARAAAYAVSVAALLAPLTVLLAFGFGNR